MANALGVPPSLSHLLLAAAWATTGLAAVVVAMRSLDGRRIPWILVAAGCLTFAVDTLVPTRPAITNFGRHVVRMVGGDELYGIRRAVQGTFLGGLTLVCALAAFRVVRTRGTPLHLRVSLVGLVLSIAWWIVEAVSYHYIDGTILYRVARLLSFSVVAGGIWMAAILKFCGPTCCPKKPHS